jgi:hypothetical protein
MRSSSICILLSLVLLINLTSCHKNTRENPEASGIKVEVLKKHHALKFNKNLLLVQPFRLKYDDKTHHLFINDLARQKIIEVDDSGNVVNEFGRKGRGPGELLSVENFFITKKHLFIVDSQQFLINKYSLDDGHYISSLDYGKYLLKRKNTSKKGIPPAPIVPGMNNYNEPFVTLRETILLSTAGKYLYEQINWKGEKLADIGEIPKGYSAMMGHEKKYWSTLENKQIPARDLAEVFPVNDRSDSNDIYLIYSAIPKIAKYSLAGRKIWERKIPRMPEIDSLLINLSIHAKVIKNHPKVNVVLIPVRTYIKGIGSPNGDLYLTTYTSPTMPDKYRRPLWIHQFTPKGKLIERYKVGSDVNAIYYPGIDFENDRIFVSFFHHANIKIYHF